MLSNLKLITRSLKTMAEEYGPIQSQIIRKLKEKFQPEHLEVINESGMHNAPKGSESHLKVIIVTDQFEKLPLLKRHRMVNEILSEEMNGLIHALSLTTKTPSEWSANNVVQPSPNCRGGFGK